MTPWMLPWERRQLLGDEKQGLRPWEKAYWGVFVTAIAFLLYSRLLKPDSAAEAAAAAARLDAADAGKVAREAAKAAAARPLLAGRGCLCSTTRTTPSKGSSRPRCRRLSRRSLRWKGRARRTPLPGWTPRRSTSSFRSGGVEAGVVEVAVVAR